MEDDFTGSPVVFDTDEGECDACGYPTHNACGQRLKCDCDYAAEREDY